MELICKAFDVKSINNIEEFNIRLNDEDENIEYNLIYSRKKLEYEHQKIIDILINLKDKGVIKSIYIPKNKKLDKELERLVRVKKEIKKSLDKIKMF
jgi:malate/lactate dehydrogenase